MTDDVIEAVNWLKELAESQRRNPKELRRYKAILKYIEEKERENTPADRN